VAGSDDEDCDVTVQCYSQGDRRVEKRQERTVSVLENVWYKVEQLQECDNQRVSPNANNEKNGFSVCYVRSVVQWFSNGVIAIITYDCQVSNAGRATKCIKHDQKHFKNLPVFV